MANIRTVRRSGRVFRGGRSRRESLWFTRAGSNNTLAAASTATILTSLNAAALALRPFTVVRVRGVLRMRSDQVALQETQDVAYGCAVVSDQAVGVGVTAVPTPATDDGSDLWYVYQRILNDLVRDVAGAGAGPLRPIGQFIEFDSRAMRKVEDGQDMIEVAETSSVSSGASIQSYARFLIKMH